MSRLEDDDFTFENEPPPHSGPRPNGKDRQLRTVTFDEIQLDLSERQLVYGVMPRRGQGCLYGEPGSAKSFILCELACCIVSGTDFLGLPVIKGVALYVAAEAPESVKRRVYARRQRYGSPPDACPGIVVESAVDLLRGDTDALLEVIATIQQNLGPIVLIIIDTLARAMTGNENMPDDMGKMVAAGGRLAEAADCFVLWCHHTGKDTAKGARGHSSLRAACDVEIEITVAEDGRRRLRLAKSRDDIVGRELGFKLQTVELGEDPLGRMVTTCVVVGCEPPQRTPSGQANRQPTGSNQKLVWLAFQKCRAKPDRKHRATMENAVPFDAVDVEELRRQAFAMAAWEGEQQRKRFHDALTGLVGGGFLTVDPLKRWAWTPDQKP